MRTVPKRLESLGRIYADRQKVYGDNYKHAGSVLAGLFPRGLTLRTREEFNRFYLFIHLLSKVSRYAQGEMKRGHEDSLDDLAVYAQMMQEVDDA